MTPEPHSILFKGHQLVTIRNALSDSLQMTSCKAQESGGIVHDFYLGECEKILVILKRLDSLGITEAWIQAEEAKQ